MKEKVRSLLEQYDLPVIATRLPTVDIGQHSTKQVQLLHTVVVKLVI